MKSKHSSIFFKKILAIVIASATSVITLASGTTFSTLAVATTAASFTLSSDVYADNSRTESITGITQCPSNTNKRISRGIRWADGRLVCLYVVGKNFDCSRVHSDCIERSSRFESVTTKHCLCPPVAPSKQDKFQRK